MHDIKYIRNNPEEFDKGLSRRGLPAEAQGILSLDQTHRDHLTEMQELQARRNSLSKEIPAAKNRGEDISSLSDEVSKIKERLSVLQDAEKDLKTQLDDKLCNIPNIPLAEVPDGKDESDNRIEKSFGTPRKEKGLKEHWELGDALGLLDIPTAVKLSGSRFSLLKGQLAKLERALGDFMLELHTVENGYLEISPPMLVRDNAAFGTANLPKFSQDLFQTTSGLWLIPTAEVPLTNIVADEILEESMLPLRFTARTACFRSEAGSAGRDTKGILRQHQFTKVELVSITTPNQSANEHERMTACAEQVLERLELPYRRVTLCTGDMSFPSVKTYDLEVWLPGQNAYREISSCSNCGDFQARRMNAKFKNSQSLKSEFVHTLNGSGLAVGRTLIAVMENYQNADGSITVPSALRPYMGNITKLEP